MPVYTTFIDEKPVVYMVHRATLFAAIRFKQNQSTAAVCTSIQHMYSLTYMGPPDHIHADPGSSHAPGEMKENMAASNMTLEEAHVENPGRYRSPKDTTPH